MTYVLVGAVGIGLGAAAWFAWRQRRPLTIVRVVALVAVAAATAAALWLTYDLRDLGPATEGAARAFENIGRGWH